MHTFQTVHDLLQSRWESDLPDKVADALRPHDGKMVSTHLLNYLPGGKETWRLRREYGMTHIENWVYTRSQGFAHDGVSLLLAHTEASFPLSLASMIERNPAYFSARVERNHARMEAMNTKSELNAMAEAMNAVESALTLLSVAQGRFGKLTEYGEHFNHDRFELERACGLRDAKGERIRS